MATNPVDVRSPDHSNDPTFALAVWITGAPPANDAAPTNLASVPAGRIVRCSGKRGSVIAVATGQLRVFVIGGTSATCAAWFYDNTMAVWVQITAATVAVSASGLVLSGLLAMIGAKLYVQIVSTSGAVTAVGYDYF